MADQAPKKILTKQEKYTMVFNKTKILQYVSITLLVCMCILRLIQFV